MIALAWPLGLAALAALAVPILIHLHRSAETHVVTFAALRWLAERPHPSTQVRLQEYVLLALRLLLLATLALLLAQPLWRAPAELSVSWIAVTPGVDAGAARAAIDMPGAEWRWLAPGFPPIDAPAPPAAEPSSLVRELDAMLPPATALTVVVPRELGDLDGERLRAGREIAWRVVDGRWPEHAPPARDEPLRIAVRHGVGDDAELAVIAALARAWEASGLTLSLDVAAHDAELNAQTDWLIWLGDEPSPAAVRWVDEGGVALVAHRPETEGRVSMTDAHGDAVVRERAVGRGRMLTMTAALSPDTMPALLTLDFPQRLRELLSAPAEAPDRALAATVAPLERANGNSHVTGTSLDDALAVLAALLFLAERLWATRSRRGVGEGSEKDRRGRSR